MLERFRKYRRYKDYYSLSCVEVRAAIVVTVIITVFIFEVFNFYEIFNIVQEDIKQIIITLLGGEFTLLGMSLAGMAIITSLISPEILAVVNKIDKEDTINRVLSHFEFSALNLGIQISYLTLVYFALSSMREVIEKTPFIICSVLICYHFFFNLFYILSLIGECIKINEIKTESGRVASFNKTIFEVANELRIDYMLQILLKEKGINKEQFLNSLYSLIDKSKISDEHKVKEYLSNYYTMDK